MKIKQILTNKWGWFGGVVLSILFFSFKFEVHGEVSGGFVFKPFEILNTFVSYITATYYPISPILVTITVFIIGFILGLISEKIYRRIK